MTIGLPNAPEAPLNLVGTRSTVSLINTLWFVKG